MQNLNAKKLQNQNVIDTTTGYLLSGERGCDLDDVEKEALELMTLLRNEKLKRVALEQLRVLTVLNV